MALQFDADPHRVALNFGTEGLAARQDLLIKSLIRILDFKTQHRWVYQPEAADVWIVTEGTTLPAQTPHPLKPCQILTICEGEKLGPCQLSRALKSDQIEDALNYVGNLLAPASATAPVTAPSLVAQATTAAAASIESFRLVRWPHTGLLANVQCIRMATLLLNRPMSLQEMVTQSGLAAAECAEFIQRLKLAGLVRLSQAHTLHAGTAPAPISLAYTPVARQQQSLFARIRNRLSLRQLA